MSTQNASSRDGEQNYGFTLEYAQGGESMRMNVGAIRNESLKDISIHDADADADADEDSDTSDDDSDETAFVAFKAVRYNVLGELSPDEVLSGKEQVERIVEEIRKAVSSQSEATNKEALVTQGAIISLADAIKAENIITKVGQRLRRAIWL